MIATLPLALDAALPSATPRAQAIALERASYAVGASAGAGFRGVVQVALDPFRQGLLDGLAGEDRGARIMSRAELFSRIRDAMKRLSDAEVAAVAARIDQGQDS